MRLKIFHLLRPAPALGLTPRAHVMRVLSCQVRSIVSSRDSKYGKTRQIPLIEFDSVSCP